MLRRIIFCVLLVALWSCSDSEEEIDCSTLRLRVTGTKDPTTCSPADGEVRVFGTGGTPPYTFRINNTSLQTDSLFTGLQGGSFVVTIIDANQCEQSLEVALTNFGSDLTATFNASENNGCIEGTGGAIIFPQGGTPPYEIRSATQTLTQEPFALSGLKNGIHPVTVADSQGCEFVLSVPVPRGKTNTSWSADVKPIIDTRCAKSTCHVAGTGRADLSKFTIVKELANQIKLRTQNKSMPFDTPMPASEIQLIACWVDDGALDN